MGTAVDELQCPVLGSDDDDAVDSVPVRLVPSCCRSGGDGEGLGVMAEVSSELSLSVLLWPLQENCRASVGVELAAPPSEPRLPLLPREGTSGRSEVRLGLRELGSVLYS